MLMTLQQTCSNYEESATLHEPCCEPFFTVSFQQGSVKEGGTGRGGANYYLINKYAKATEIKTTEPRLRRQRLIRESRRCRRRCFYHYQRSKRWASGAPLSPKALKLSLYWSGEVASNNKGWTILSPDYHRTYWEGWAHRFPRMYPSHTSTQHMNSRKLLECFKPENCKMLKRKI